MMLKVHLTSALLLAILAAPPFAFAQFPGGGQPGGGGGRRGGGGGGGGGDPNQFFDRIANGKETINVSEADPRVQGMLSRMGVTSAQVTREQFVNMMRERQAQRGGGGGGGAGGGGQGAPGGNNQGADRGTAWADALFRQLDQNQDGVLNNDEMPDALRAERDKWDTDKNGLIDQNEFRAYFQARLQQLYVDRGQGNGGGLQGGMVDPNSIIPATPAEPEEKKPVVYRFGKLPKELPAWFQELDTDQDGQVGLYEWRAGGRTIEEFLKMDRNHDGFLTVEEVLRYQAQNGKGSTAVVMNGQATNGSDTTPPARVSGRGNGGSDNAQGRGNGGGNGGNRQRRQRGQGF